MTKNILLTTVLCCSFFCARAAESNEDVQSLLEQVDFVLFVLERNTIRMERYGLHELNDEINYLSKDLSKSHCQFKLSLTGKDFRAYSISWDEEDFSRLKILSGKRREPNIYYLLLSKIFPPAVQLDDLPLICFECVVRHVDERDSETQQIKRIRRGPSRTKSLVDVVVPFGDDCLTTQLILDGSVRSVCGFFVQHDAFGSEIPLSGKIKKEEAFAEGLLVVADPDEKAATLDAQVVEAVMEAKTGASDSVGASVFAKLMALKNFFGTTWSKFIGCFGL